MVRVRRHDAGELVRQEVGDEEPRMGLFQQFRAVFLNPDELVNGVEGKGAHAGDTVKLFLGDILADVFHNLRRAGAFPGNDRVKLPPFRVHQRAVHAEGGDGYRPHLFHIQALKGLHGAFGELLENPVRVPDVEFRISSPAAWRSAARPCPR